GVLAGELETDLLAEAVGQVAHGPVVLAEDPADRDHAQLHDLVAQVGRDPVDAARSDLEVVRDLLEHALDAAELVGELADGAALPPSARLASRRSVSSSRPSEPSAWMPTPRPDLDRTSSPTRLSRRSSLSKSTRRVCFAAGAATAGSAAGTGGVDTTAGAAGPGLRRRATMAPVSTSRACRLDARATRARSPSSAASSASTSGRSAVRLPSRSCPTRSSAAWASWFMGASPTMPDEPLSVCRSRNRSRT